MSQRRHADRHSISRCRSAIRVIIRREEHSLIGEAPEALGQDGEGHLQAVEESRVQPHSLL